AQGTCDLMGALGFCVIKLQPARSLCHGWLTCRTVYLVHRVEPINHALRGIGKQAQRRGTKSVAGIIDEVLAGLNMLALIWSFCAFWKEHESAERTGYRGSRLGDRVICVINDADRPCLGAQRRGMARTQRRQRGEGINCLGAHFCDARTQWMVQI